MDDEWDEYADLIAKEKNQDKENPPRAYNDPSMSGIALELRGWWSGIKDGSIKFIHGLPLLREFVPAYIPGHVIVISGYTSAGKSQLLSQLIAWTAGVQEASTLVFSLEDSRLEKNISLISCVTETVHRKRMLLGDIDGYQDEIDRAIEHMSFWPLKIYDDVYRISEMEKLIIEHKPKIVVLDYIQNVTSNGQGIYERMSEAALFVFMLAQKYGVTFFVASQIDNQAAREESNAFISLKGAGELAAIAHTVIHLKKGRDNDNRHEVQIYIKKNKAFGSCGEMKAEFNEHWTKIIGVNNGKCNP